MLINEMSESREILEKVVAKEGESLLDIEFEKHLDQKKTLRRDYKMKGDRFRDCVLYVLISLDLEPNFGNFRKYDPILDWEAICMNDLRRKGIIS